MDNFFRTISDIAAFWFTAVIIFIVAVNLLISESLLANTAGFAVIGFLILYMLISIIEFLTKP